MEHNDAAGYHLELTFLITNICNRVNGTPDLKALSWGTMSSRALIAPAHHNGANKNVKTHGPTIMKRTHAACYHLATLIHPGSTSAYRTSGGLNVQGTRGNCRPPFALP